MALASWIRVPKFSFSSIVSQKGHRRSSRRPTSSRPFLEYLEERTLLDAGNSSGVIGSAFNNIASVNGGFASNGVTPPVLSDVPQTTAVAQVNGDIGANLAAVAGPLAQDQLNSQFRLFAVNSQGENNQFQQTTVNILFDAYGFGSGVQPNAPWKPAAYNVGLANHQYGYASQSDQGFQSVPPWFHSSMQLTQYDQPLDDDVDAKIPKLLFLHQVADDQEQAPLISSEDSGDKSSEQNGLENKSALDSMRGDPAVEEALFSDPLHTLTATTGANRLTMMRLESGKRLLDSGISNAGEAASEDSAIPSSLWVSALAPAQIAALVIGLPAVKAPAAPVGNGEISLEGAE